MMLLMYIITLVRIHRIYIMSLLII